MIMEKKNELPKEVVAEIKTEAKLRGKNHMFIPMDGDYSSHKFHGFIVERTYETCATAYATKLHQAKETIKVLTYDNNRLKGEVGGLNRWKEEAKAIINPIWEYADTLKVPLGESKTEAVIKHAKELEHQNDKMKATATGWRPLLEEVLKHDAAFGELSIEIIDKIKKFLYGE